MTLATFDNGSNTNSTAFRPPSPPLLPGMDSDRVTCLSLKAQLEAAMCKAIQLGQGEAQSFLPSNELHRLVTQKSVLRTLQGHGLGFTDDIRNIYASTIASETSKLRKIFAILVLIDRPDAVFGFIRNSITDDVLPLEPTLNRLGEETTVVRSKTTPACFDLTLAGLDGHDAAAFEETQWMVISPFLGQLVGSPIQYHSRAILPFIWDEPAEPTTQTGGHSKVYQARIHPAHHSFEGHDEARVAIKQLHSTDDEAFKREVEALQRFADDSNPHIVKLLTAFKCGETSYLVFPWADCDLQSFWATNDRLPAKADHATLTVRQMLGVAQALKAIHYCIAKKRSKRHDIDPKPVIEEGSHGDLKPENILVVDGQWKLADFGLSRFRHQAESGEDRPLGFSPTYRAPEHDIGPFNGQKADIWSLGCVMSVAATWMTLGRKGVQKFRSRRAALGHDLSSKTAGKKVDDSFFEVTRDKGWKPEPKVKPVVTKWIDKLHRTPDASPLIHDLLELVQHGMLEVDGDKRITSDELVEKLEGMHRKCTDDPSYTQRDLRHGLSKSLVRTVKDSDITMGQPRSISVNTFQLPQTPRRTWPTGSEHRGAFSPDTGAADPPWEKCSTLPAPASRAYVHQPTSWGQLHVHQQTPWNEAQTASSSSAVGYQYPTPVYTQAPVPVSTYPANSPDSPSSKRRRDCPTIVQGPAKRLRPDAANPPSLMVPHGAGEAEGRSPGSSPESSPKRLLACPYFKKTPQKYGIKKYPCGGPGWTIPRLKEHIRRHHLASGYRCSRCLQLWSTELDLSQHHREEVQCPKASCQTDDDVDEMQWAIIQERHRGKSEVFKWGVIYRTIFRLSSGATIPSPYRDEPNADETLAEFCMYLASCLQKHPNPLERSRVEIGLGLISEFRGSRSVSQSTTMSDLPPLVDEPSQSMPTSLVSPVVTEDVSPSLNFTSTLECNLEHDWIPRDQGNLFNQDFTLFQYTGASLPLEGVCGSWYPPLMSQSDTNGNLGLPPGGSSDFHFGFS